MLSERGVQIQFRKLGTPFEEGRRPFGETGTIFWPSGCFRLDAFKETDLSAAHNHGGQ